MGISLPSLPYGQSGSGFWGQKTSTLNFCEEDYVLSHYCAELCNTVTNAIFLYLGVKGVRSCLNNGHPSIFAVAFIGYATVGTGSVLFHATLKYPMQLVDELGMIYTTCLMMYASFSFQRSRTVASWLAIGLLGLAAFITAYYHKTKDPVFHQVVYAILTAIILFRSMWIMESQLRPMLKVKDQQYARAVLGTMWRMIATGIGVFLGGFFIWNLDNIFCDQARGYRRAIGLPWGVFLEGHAWWHLMTGLGGMGPQYS
ncbi:ceramidase domain-containing protein [Sarocladium implicatum]|nr:ceramidase domain-containing protein [Sarocladium implicatum]